MKSNSHKTGCIICGKELVYTETAQEVQCVYCNRTFSKNEKCIDGHYVCDRCHSASANELIQIVCTQTESEDPLEIAITLMRNPTVKMHGPEHHFLIPAVLLSSYYNTTNKPEEKKQKIQQARKRAEKVLGGFCGFYGNCGAAVGTGIFLSLITNATPLSEQEWKWSNLITAQTLFSVAKHGGPRCCKRNTYLALIEATTFLRKHFDVYIPVNKTLKCEFNDLNKECKKFECPFFDSSNENVL